MADPVRSKILISPSIAAVLVVDGQMHLKRTPDGSKDSVVFRALKGVLRGAEDLSVPVVSTLFRGGNGNSAKPLSVIANLSHFERAELNPWENGAVRESLAKLGRDAIVIVGNCVEGGVTFAALGALEHGYQAYVVVDAISSTSDLELRTAIERMTQAGVVAITSRQLLLEWGRQ